MSLQQTLDTMSTTIQKASSLPLSSSCVVNRVDMLTLVEEARGSVPREMRAAANVLSHREQLISEAQELARRTLHEARLTAEEMVATSMIVERAQRQAAEILTDARDEAARLLRDADEYCERRLGDFQDDLSAAVAQVQRGRERLRARVAEADHRARIAAEEDEPILGQAEAAVPAPAPAEDPVTDEIPVVPAAEAAPEGPVGPAPASPQAEVEVEAEAEPEVAADGTPAVRAEILEIDLRDPRPEPAPAPAAPDTVVPGQEALFEEPEPEPGPEPVPVPLDAEEPADDDVPGPVRAEETQPEGPVVASPDDDRPMLVDLTALERRVAAAEASSGPSGSAVPRPTLRDQLFPRPTPGASAARPEEVGEDDIYVPGRARAADEPFDQRAGRETI